MPVKPVTKEEMLRDVWNKRVFLSDTARYECLRAMDSWAALQTGERNERIEKLQKRLLEYTEITGTLIEAQDRIEELTNLLYDQWWRRHKEAGISETDIQTAWQQFKTKYNL